MYSCIFCRISRGEIKAYKLFEDEETCAFLDAYPLARGHTLVIPKRHAMLLEELSSSEVQRLFSIVHRLNFVIKAAVEAPATTIAINNGKESGQEVDHVHIHIIPRSRRDRGGPIHAIMKEKPHLTPQEMGETADRIKELISSQKHD
jgi:histidine triad (HIT) family protein